MRFGYNEFPENENPIYDFHIADDGGLRVRKYRRYETEKNALGRISYRIHTGAGIVTKRADQMDRVLAGHVFTLDYRPARVLELMQERAEADAVRAAVMAESARSCKEAVLQAMKTPVIEETYATVTEQRIRKAWMPAETDAK